MKKNHIYFYLFLLLLFALVINENIIQWALAVKIGKYTLSDGFKDAFKYFSFGGYLFFTAFRLIPYVALGIILTVLSKTKFSNYIFPVFIGGLIGILAIFVWGSWMSLRPFYTDEHVSSTTALAFIFIPLYSVPSGIIGAGLFSFLFFNIKR